MAKVKAYNGNDPYIFVSYSHGDQERAERFIEALQKKYNVWFDEGLPYGNDFVKIIESKIRGCSLFIYLVTNASLESKFCNKEIRWADELGKNFINVIADPNTVLTNNFKFLYGGYQMCLLDSFESDAAAIEDLERKCEWFECARRAATAERRAGIPEAEKIPLTKAQVGDRVVFGSYEQNGGKEGIEWLVLAKERERLLVISSYGLDCRPYNSSYASVSWETCSMRKWLNETFFGSAFTPGEQAMIPSATVAADRNPDYRTHPGYDTTDKVFLLSLTEVRRYFDSDAERECLATEYAKAQKAFTEPGGNCWWWLRSPGVDSYYASFVYTDGSDYSRGYIVSNDFGAVRPAMWIDLGA